MNAVAQINGRNPGRRFQHRHSRQNDGAGLPSQIIAVYFVPRAGARAPNGGADRPRSDADCFDQRFRISRVERISWCVTGRHWPCRGPRRMHGGR
jgi:hypothetical protein